MNRGDYYNRDIAFLTAWNTPVQIAYNFNVSLRHKYIYCQTPKAACSTVKRFLILNEGYCELPFETATAKYDQLDMLHMRDFSPLLNPKQLYPFKARLGDPDFFKFCFVRNPYSRVLSAYLDKVVHNRDQVKQVKAVLGRTMYPATKISFADFVRVVVETPIGLMDTHWKNQYHHLCADVINYDFIGKFENIDSDLAEVARRAGLDIGLYRDYSPHRSHASDLTDKYYTKTLRDMVYKKFQADFETFGYEK